MHYKSHYIFFVFVDVLSNEYPFLLNNIIITSDPLLSSLIFYFFIWKSLYISLFVVSLNVLFLFHLICKNIWKMWFKVVKLFSTLAMLFYYNLIFIPLLKFTYNATVFLAVLMFFSFLLFNNLIMRSISLMYLCAVLCSLNSWIWSLMS